MSRLILRAACLLGFAVLAATSVTLPAAAETVTPAQVTTIDLSAAASRSAANDLAQATAFFEAQDANAADLARRVNRSIATGLEAAKAYPGVKARTGATSTWPVHGKGGRSIEGWRTRSEILLETRDTAALSDLLGKLQDTLSVGQISLQPAPETRRKAEDAAALEAIAAFRARAALIAKAFDKTYRLRQMTVNTTGDAQPIHPLARASLAAEAAPMPVQAGETTVTVSVTGQIELPLE